MGFLEQMVLKLVFHPTWVEMIMQCVSSVTYNIIFNGVETKEIIPSSCSRQGDPLSPYLYLICSEGLSSLLAHEQEVRGIEGCWKYALEAIIK